MNEFNTINELLLWLKNKNFIAFKFYSKTFNYVEDIITNIDFYSLEDEDGFIYRINLPINKKRNNIILRIIRKSLFELDKKFIVSKHIKEFLNFIPGKFVLQSKLYDIDLIDKITNNSIDNEIDLKNYFSYCAKILNKKIIKIYEYIIEPSISIFSDIEKNGLPSKYNTRLYTFYNLNGTVSGRLANTSFESKKFINVLNFPKNERSIIQAPKGYKILSADYSAMEINVLSNLCEDETLINILKQDIDFYEYIALNVFNLKNYSGDYRTIIKDLCFTIIYGGTEYGFSKTHHCSIEESRNMIHRFYSHFPKIEEWILKNQIQILEKGYVKNIFGRKRVFDLNNDSDTILRQGQNFLVQSTAHDIVLLTIIELYNELKNDIKILMDLHDEIIFLVDEHKIEGVKNMIINIMSKPSNLCLFNLNNLIFKVKTRTGNSWE